MEEKLTNNWMKHWDFMLLDLFFLLFAYLISILLGNGFFNLVYFNVGIIICLADICTVFFLEDYGGIMRRGYFKEFKSTLKHVAAVSVIEITYLFLSKSADNFSRLSFILFAVFAIGLVYTERVLWKSYLLNHKKVFYKKKAILIITTKNRAKSVLKTFRDNTYNELKIIGAVIVDDDSLVDTKIEGVPVVCQIDKALDYLQTRWVDGIFINVRRGVMLPENFTETCINMGITVNTKIAHIDKGSKNQKLDTLGGYVVLSSNIHMVSLRQLIIKRTIDIIGSIVGLLFTGLLTLFIGPILYFSSPGPIFFSQVRLGKNGRRFKIYKFRSMYMDAEERKKELMEKNEMQGLMFKMEADPRIIGSGEDGTKKGIGCFIRKTSIDEFPQFWNVLKGEMSLVGTRRSTLDEWEHYEHHHRGRMAVKPGLTGMWQVSGRSDITDFEEVVNLDMQYIKNWNIGLDIKILLKTVLVVFAGSGSK